jgi:hypothetical protein
MKRGYSRLQIRYILRAPGRTARFAKTAHGDDYDIPSVRKEGNIKWQGANIFISELLRHQPVRLRHIEGDLFGVFFGATLLGEIDGYRKTFIGRSRAR